MGYVPSRGDAVWVNLNPLSGREQAGRRLALVLSPFTYSDKVGLALVCPITNQAKRYVFEVKIPEGFRVKGVILANHVKSADCHTRDMEFICKLPESVVEDVIEKLNVLLKI